MKKTFISLFLVLTFWSSSYSQEGFSLSLDREYYITTGISMPTSESRFDGRWNTGFNVGAGIGLTLGDASTLVFDFMYSRFTYDNTNLNSALSTGGGYSLNDPPFSLFNFSVGLKYLFSSENSNILPYVIGNVGIHSDNVGDEEYIEAGSNKVRINEGQTKLGTSFGFGIEHPIGSNWGYFAEIKYSVAFTEFLSGGKDHTIYIPIKLGIMFF